MQNIPMKIRLPLLWNGLRNIPIRIGLFGGFDLNLLILQDPDMVFRVFLNRVHCTGQRQMVMDLVREIQFPVIFLLMDLWQ